MPGPRATSVCLPPSLALLVRVRAEREAAAPEEVLGRAVLAFASLSWDERAAALNDYTWAGADRSLWRPFRLPAAAADLAVLCAARAWRREQVVLAAVAWYFSAP